MIHIKTFNKPELLPDLVIEDFWVSGTAAKPVNETIYPYHLLDTVCLLIFHYNI